MTWMSVLYSGCRPWLFWSLISFGSMLKLQASHDLTKDIRKFDRTTRVGKTNNHTPGILYTTFLGEKRTHPLQENNIKIQLASSGHFQDAGFTAQSYMKLRVSIAPDI